MTAWTVAELLSEVGDVIRDHRFGLIELTGTLTAWRVQRSGLDTGELTTGHPPSARLAIVARRHAAAAVRGELADAGRPAAAPGLVTVHGHLRVDPRWGLQLELLRLRCTGDLPPPAAPSGRVNALHHDETRKARAGPAGARRRISCVGDSS